MTAFTTGLRLGKIHAGFVREYKRCVVAVLMDIVNNSRINPRVGINHDIMRVFRMILDRIVKEFRLVEFRIVDIDLVMESGLGDFGETILFDYTNIGFRVYGFKLFD
jgi:hypothetical protein